MSNPFRKVWAFIKGLFGGGKADTPMQQQQCETKSTKPMENAAAKPRSRVGQTLVKAYRTTNEVAGAIMLPDKAQQSIPKLRAAGHKIGWVVAHPKVAATKAFTWCASFWHAGAGWAAKAAACLSAPGVIAAVVIVVVGAVWVPNGRTLKAPVKSRYLTG